MENGMIHLKDQPIFIVQIFYYLQIHSLEMGESPQNLISKNETH